MTKKKQSKRSAKQGGKKSSSRAGVAPTLHEIPAIKPGQPLAEAPVDAKTLSAPEAQTPKEPVTSSTEKPITETPTAETATAEKPTTETAVAETPTAEKPTTETAAAEKPTAETPTHVDPQIDAHALSAPEPIHPEPAPTDIAAEPTSHTSIAAAVTDQVIEPQPTTKDGNAVESAAVVETGSSAPAASSPSPSITNDIPMPATLTSSAAAQDSGAVSAAQAQDSTGALPGQVQKTKYDIEAVKNAAPGVTPTASTAPALNPQSLGSLTRSKSRSEVARGLSSSGKEEGYKWRPPVDYFGASASAFSSSFSGSSNRDLNALKKPSDAQNNNAASATPPQPTAPHPAMPPNPTPFANAPGTGPTTIKPLPFSAPNSSPFGNAPLPAPAPLPLPVPPVPPVPAVPVVPPVPPVPAVPPVSPPFPSGATPAVPPAPTVPPQPLPNQPGPATPLKVYESTTDATALSPKMAKFIESLREREITGSGSAPTMPQAATSVDLNAVPQQQAATSVDMNAAPQAPAAPVQPATAPSVLKPSSEAKPSSTPATADQTSRDLAPLAKENDAEAPPSKSTGDTPLAPKSSSQVAELRESIISQKADGQSDDWHPIGEKKSPRKVDPQFSAELDDFKTETIRHKSDSERHLTLEEMAAMDPDLLLAPQTPQQQSIRRLKNAGGIHAEIYIPIYLICIGLSWVTEQSAVSGTFRDAGQRVESSLQLIAPKTLAENFRAGVDAFDDRDIKLHPFNPNKPRSIVSLLISRIQAFCSGLSSAFSRIPGTIASSTANNPLAQVMVLLSYLSVFSLALMIYFRFKRSTSWIIADFILLPIGLVAASTVITAVLISVLSMSVSLGAGIVSNTIVLYTTLAVVLCVSDMARRTFFRRKNQ